MEIRLNAFVEEIVRAVDHVVCRENPAFKEVPSSLRVLIVARKLLDVGVATKGVDHDAVELWRPSQGLEARMGNSDVTAPIEVDVDFDFSQSRQIMRYVSAVHRCGLIESAVEKAVDNAIAFNNGFVELAGWDKNGHRRWVQTALGRKMASAW